jgi:diguanylate cyclase (GGDEF)-like protein
MPNLQSSMREVAVLQAASEMVLSSMDADTVLHQILLIVRNFFDISHCAILLTDTATKELYCSAQIGYDPSLARSKRFAIGREGVSGYVAATKGPEYVPDVSKDARYIAIHPEVKCLLSIPLVVREEAVGVLNLESDKIDFFTDEMIGLLALFATQAAVALDNSRLYATERKRMRQIEFVNLIARSSTSASSMDQLLMTVSELLSDTFEGCDAAILVRNAAGKFEIGATTDASRLSPERVDRSADSGLLSDAMRARSNVVNDGSIEHIVVGAQSELVLPLIALRETLGIVLLYSDKPHAFSADDRSIAQATADVCATAIRNVQLSNELSRVTNTDALTGAYNQRYLHFSIAQEISRAKRFGNSFVLIALDVRGFKSVNAQHGFGKGDELLKALASRLRTSTRSVDTVCRYEADTFVLVVPEISGLQATSVEQKLASVMAEAQHEVMKATLGVTRAMAEFPADGDSELQLLRTLLKRLQMSKSAKASAAPAS